MRFSLTAQLLDEARRFELRSACRDCFYWSPQRNECWHGWPDEGQRRWPLSMADDQAASVDGLPSAPITEAAFCKEFELL